MAIDERLDALAHMRNGVDTFSVVVHDRTRPELTSDSVLGNGWSSGPS